MNGAATVRRWSFSEFEARYSLNPDCFRGLAHGLDWAASTTGAAQGQQAPVGLTHTWSFGGVAVLRHHWDALELDRLFSPPASARQAGLLRALIFGRILFPSAKLALVDHARGTLLASACGLDQATEDFDEDDLYAAMDELSGRWVGMEKQLYQQAFPAGVSLALYDLTSVYFEGAGPLGISQYGHSRDHRSDRPQVLLAVAADARGLPLHLEVLRGNRGDTTTLQGLLSTLRRRFGIKEAVFVFDGGMSSKVNLEALETLGLQYVTRLGAGLLDELPEGWPAQQAPELWDRTQVMEIVREGKRYVIRALLAGVERGHDLHQHVLAPPSQLRHRDALAALGRCCPN